ncbi:MAG: hypothetical protein H6522_02505 [Mycolicibacterium sp.]|nr:hypothetical protein [Mycolicibacterium sp.]
MSIDFLPVIELRCRLLLSFHRGFTTCAAGRWTRLTDQVDTADGVSSRRGPADASLQPDDRCMFESRRR